LPEPADPDAAVAAIIAAVRGGGVTHATEQARQELSQLREVLGDVRDALAAFLGRPDGDLPEMIAELERGGPLAEVETRLTAILGSGESFSGDCRARVHALLEAVQEMVDATAAQIARDADVVKSKATMEMIDRKLRRYLGREVSPDLAVLGVEPVLADITELCDQINLEMSNAGKLSLNFMFDGVFRLFKPSSVTDPVIYIPEFCCEFAALVESVRCLDAFARILSETVDSFDCRIESFKPASHSFAFIRDQVFRLQSLLNETSPKTIHAPVFAVVSHFVGLLSSFVSALSAQAS
jgi:hypothetical protein